jgi:hypothetical protein
MIMKARLLTKARLFTSAALLLSLFLLFLANSAASAAVGPFGAMAGSWAGGGTLTMADGNAERLRCRASYDVGGTGTDLQLHLKCASASYHFDLASDVVYQGGRISGSWSEASHNANGAITGHASGDRIEAAANGQSFAANLSLITHGSRQTISIRSQGTDIAGVTLALNRR